MAKNKLKDAKFFCESCGSEVPRNAKVCPVCGRFFASVRCPKCGRTGTNDDFKNGCPSCGYAVDLSGFGSQNHEDSAGSFDSKKNKRTKNKNKRSFFIKDKNKKQKAVYKGSNTTGDSSLPLWVYIFTILIFVVLVVCLYSCL